MSRREVCAALLCALIGAGVWTIGAIRDSGPLAFAGGALIGGGLSWLFTQAMLRGRP